jgi:hypothetical protein
MYEKTYLILAVALAVLIALISVLCSINNEEESTPPAQVTAETAIKNAQNKFDEKSKETITNFDNPKVEEVVFDSPHQMAYFGDMVDVVGKPLYKITFNTTKDALLGPIVIYVDKSDGNPIGMDFRM